MSVGSLDSFGFVLDMGESPLSTDREHSRAFMSLGPSFLNLVGASRPARHVASFGRECHHSTRSPLAQYLEKLAQSFRLQEDCLQELLKGRFLVKWSVHLDPSTDSFALGLVPGNLRWNVVEQGSRCFAMEHADAAQTHIKDEDLDHSGTPSGGRRLSLRQ